jgi:outer membrane protein TolC
LAKEVKTAYFNYLKTSKISELFDATEALLRENLRVSQSLFDNGKATADVVFRARAELSRLEQQKLEARRNRDLAQAYFNFLLNRPLEQPVETEDVTEPPQVPAGDIEELQAQALEARHELYQVVMAIEAARSGVRLAQTAFLPGVVLAYDYGYQGEDFSFGEDDDFWMGSVVLEWNLFDGLQRESRIGQARAERRKLEAQHEELKVAVSLQVKEAYENLIVADQSLAAARDQLASAEKSFEIVEKKYAEGMVAQIEYLDARTAMTHAEINLIVTAYDCHIRHAELERVLAAYPVGNLR